MSAAPKIVDLMMQNHLPAHSEGRENLPRRRIGVLLFAGVFGASLGAVPHFALAAPGDSDARGGPVARPRWRLAGSVQARKSVDRDVVRISADRAYSAIKLRVLHAPVEILNLRIQFRNGGARDIEVRQRIEQGGSTRVIDLPGERRFIDSVVFWHKTPLGARERATVEVWIRG